MDKIKYTYVNLLLTLLPFFNTHFNGNIKSVVFLSSASLTFPLSLIRYCRAYKLFWLTLQFCRRQQKNFVANPSEDLNSDLIFVFRRLLQIFGLILLSLVHFTFATFAFIAHISIVVV